MLNLGLGVVEQGHQLFLANKIQVWPERDNGDAPHTCFFVSQKWHNQSQKLFVLTQRLAQNELDRRHARCRVCVREALNGQVAAPSMPLPGRPAFDERSRETERDWAQVVVRLTVGHQIAKLPSEVCRQ